MEKNIRMLTLLEVKCIIRQTKLLYTFPNAQEN